jgi:hypothetical protein
MFIQEHNCETGEITQRELTAKEIKDRQDEYDTQVVADQAKATAKASVLAQLGITEEQAKLLLS